MRPNACMSWTVRQMARRIALFAAWLALWCICPAVLADLLPAEGYSVRTVQKPGAVFSGLAADRDALLVTDLATGRIYRYDGSGRFAAFGPDLPHGVDVLGEPTGPYRIAGYGNNYLVTIGWTPVGSQASALDHALLEIDENAVVKVVRDDFLNPFDFTLSGDTVLVIDAGRNSLERVSADGRVRETIFAFARLSEPRTALKHLSPTEFSGAGNYEFDAVPTGIAALNGRVYVSLFGGFPFLPGSGRVVSLDEHGDSPTARVEAIDLNAPVDLAFSSEGHLLVLEHGTFSEAGSFRTGSGRLVVIDADSGTRQVLLDGLTRPAAALILDQRTIVISELGGRLIFLERR
jgi:hypothetical protein